MLVLVSFFPGKVMIDKSDCQMGRMNLFGEVPVRVEGGVGVCFAVGRSARHPGNKASVVTNRFDSAGNGCIDVAVAQ